ncbi:N-acetyl-alpha-D-glucosaminyl L-malate synthase BshA [Mechercharimyces sp. CAU 1602]|uniref:N-acetyl-alpha-D-glucosaminyl L-malate synthase BshA n=1 Tax=Mechercharimyces sp. CAU 1602 TaxID=2973933 RepID=UPI002163FBB5|nr:N-acetyl-alpha-D-glucosaminyl L-malate synthase BshA [Mechercharimyces sp. CAU 1602]MCS1351011.1 N-acetyl-alpha-D-glucosaminyl L-malate synthase BshA [Mechercharimyces sp. CAU 1602]
MRIGITCYPTHGGSGVVATELGKLLAERGHQVHFITYDMPFRLGGFHHNIHYHAVEANHYALFRYPPYDLSLASRMAQVAKQHQLDILHVHYAVPHAICAYLAKQMSDQNFKVVTTLHGTDITILGEDPSLKDIITFGIQQSDAVTAVSGALIQQTHDLLCAQKSIERIYNFVDHRMYYPRDVTDIRSQYAREDEHILFHMSNFRPVKRIGDVIRIFERVQQEVPARLLLVGEGPELPKMREEVEKMGLSKKVCFLGKQDEVARLISLADLLLLPSEKESFGLVALEAMACGVPTIGSTADGIPEVVKNGETGWLAEVGEVEEMATKAITLLTDRDQYQAFSQNGLARSRDTFCGDRIVDQYEVLYQRVLEETQ